MAYRRYLVPLAVFVIMWVAGAMTAAFHKASIRRVINAAGEKRQPIIVGICMRKTRLSWWAVFSMESGPIPLDMNRGMHFVSATFGKDGSLYLSPYVGEHPMRAKSTVEFPDYRIQPSEEVDFSGFSEEALEHRASHSFWSDSKWFAEVSDEGLIACDTLSGAIRQTAFDSSPPWLDAGDWSDRPIRGYLSPDGTALVAAAEVESFTEADTLWRYDIETGAWSFLATAVMPERPPLVVGPSAAVVALFVQSGTTGSHGPGTGLVFIDEAGVEIVSEQRGIAPVIGHRWAACTSPGFGQSRAVVVFDMENNWQRSILPWKDIYVHAICEPPPNGLDGMLDNYDWGEAE